MSSSAGDAFHHAEGEKQDEFVCSNELTIACALYVCVAKLMILRAIQNSLTVFRDSPINPYDVFPKHESCTKPTNVWVESICDFSETHL